MSKFTFPQEMKIVEAIAPAADAAGRSSACVTLKGCGRAFLKIHITQGNAATIALTPMQATAIAKTSGKVLANAVPIWANLDTAATDTLVRATDAVNYTTDAGVKNKQIIFQIDPSQLDVAGGFDCVYFTTGASNAANITQAEWILTDLKHSSKTPASAIAD